MTVTRVPRARSFRVVPLVLLCVLLPSACTSQSTGQSTTSTTLPSSATLTSPASPASSDASGNGTGLPSSSPANPSTPVGPPSSGIPAPSPNAARPPDLTARHDATLAALLSTLGQALRAGSEPTFLAAFAPALKSRAGHWFANTRALGVVAAAFTRSDDYPSGATDSTTSFSRTVTLGIRTPYDDTDSMPGIPYGITVSATVRSSRPVYTITAWQPKYLSDPMNCTCTLSVVHNASIAVVVDAADPDLVFWSRSALDAATKGISWATAQAAGSGLSIPRGQVIFLADKPFHWFLSTTGPGQTSNVTAGLMDALGDHPGTRYSTQSRIVITLQQDDGTVLPDDDRGRQYVEDVTTHESTHQLMNRNSKLPSRSDNSPPTWVVEGIAVAVETLHRDSLGEDADIGYPEPNDPQNTRPTWFDTHVTGQMPTRDELQSAFGVDRAGYYAVSGSVFRYIEREYGYRTMLTVAAAMYAQPAQTPFDYFPDTEHPGSHLSQAIAQGRWKEWFAANYE